VLAILGAFIGGYARHQQQIAWALGDCLGMYLMLVLVRAVVVSVVIVARRGTVMRTWWPESRWGSAVLTICLILSFIAAFGGGHAQTWLDAVGFMGIQYLIVVAVRAIINFVLRLLWAIKRTAPP